MQTEYVSGNLDEPYRYTRALLASRANSRNERSGISTHTGTLAVTFTTIFDAGQQRYATWSFPAFGLIFVVLGALMVFRSDVLDFLPARLPPKSQLITERFFS